MYSLPEYGGMIADAARTGGYVEALRQSIKPGDVVVDVGTGTGILAFYACKFGAKRVFAIEPNPLIEFGRLCAKKNGLSDRIQFFEARSIDVELGELADVLVSDLRGSTPLNGVHLSAIIDARSRFLKPGGKQIPLTDTMFVAPIEAPELYRGLLDGWDGHGFDFSPCRNAVLNQRHLDPSHPIRPTQFLATPKTWATLDYTKIELPRVSGEVSFDVSRDGVFHGMGGWFKAQLTSGVQFNNEPSDRSTVYAHTFLPLEEPVALRRGDSIHVAIQAWEGAGDIVLGWTTRISGSVEKKFKQSELNAAAASMSNLRRFASGSTRALSIQGKAVRRALDLLATGTSPDKTASCLVEEMLQTRYPSALLLVNGLVDRFCL